MQLSVIILNYNVKNFLEACIKSVQKAIQNIDAEIIVVDNNSTDGSREMMKLVFPEISYLFNDYNAGFPKGNNQGVALAKGKYLCILNPDTIVAEQTFTSIFKHIQNLSNFGILGCKLIDGSGNFLPESKRGIPTPWVAFTKVLGLYKFFPNSKLFNKYYAQNISETENGKVDILVGAFMFLERELYLKVGGFDEGCFMYSDDIDLSYLSLKEGKQNYYFSEVSCIHFKGESTLKDGAYMNRFKEAMQFFYRKHFSSSIIFDAMMDVGISLFALKKKTEIVKEKYKPEKYLLLTKDIQHINEINGISVVEFSDFDELIFYLEKNIQKNLEILYDSNYFSHDLYIKTLERFKNLGFTFKLKPANSEFFLGSNDKNDRGEVLFLK
nr:glycosyltransferase family 2 protein [uncultured Flavobacterium sp.]